MTVTYKKSIPKNNRFCLKSVEIKNYRCFRDIVIDLDENMTVLIARNGAGKTAVLDAIATSLGTFVGSFHTGKGAGIDNSDVHLLLTNPDLREMERQYPAAIFAQA